MCQDIHTGRKFQETPNDFQRQGTVFLYPVRKNLYRTGEIQETPQDSSHMIQLRMFLKIEF